MWYRICDGVVAAAPTFNIVGIDMPGALNGCVEATADEACTVQGTNSQWRDRRKAAVCSVRLNRQSPLNIRNSDVLQEDTVAAVELDADRMTAAVSAAAFALFAAMRGTPSSLDLKSHCPLPNAPT